MDDAQWFDFNDSSVGRIQPNTIEDVFGEEEGNSRYSFFNSGANAYMLMYRQGNTPFSLFRNRACINTAH
jgi:hypothetical protein